MKKMAVIIMVIVLSFILFSNLASAQRHGSGHFGGWHSGGRGPRGYGWGLRFYAYPGWGWPYPYYYSYPYPSYLPPPEATEQTPVYSEPEQQQPYYWYYCQNPQGYYPYIRSCPGGWMQVKPNVTPPNP